MPNLENIKADLIQALKAKKSIKAEVLRMLVSALKNKQINEKKESLSESEVAAIIKSESKKRQDSIKAFQAGGRSDLANKEQEELDILKVYLPAQLSEAEVRARVKEIKEQSGLNQFGPLMGKIMASLGPSADGQVVQRILKEEFGK